MTTSSSTLIEKISAFPNSPGVYLMKNAAGDVIYVGKAKDLKKRVSNYFGKVRDTRYQIAALMGNVRDIEFITTSNDKEALLLEYKLIQDFRPKYNIEFKDSKKYVSIKLSVYHEFPGIYVTHQTPADRSQYFGPYTSSQKARAIVKLLIKHFRLRNCKDVLFANRSRPCIQYEIGLCSAPCVGLIAGSDYKKGVDACVMFLRGDTRKLIKGLTKEMRLATKERRYEDAANLRDAVLGIKFMLEHPVKDEEYEKPPKPDLSLMIKRKLGLERPPAIIECVDISNIQGKHAVGSMISFVKGEPEKSLYKRFKIRLGDSPDDYSMMHEVLTRRFKHAGTEDRKWRPPDLLLVDGGKGHLMIAEKVLKELGCVMNIAAIAKGKDRKSDQVYLPERKNPLKLKRSHPVLLYFMRIRDEAHRFGINYYRAKHKKGLFE